MKKIPLSHILFKTRTKTSIDTQKEGKRERYPVRGEEREREIRSKREIEKEVFTGFREK